MNHVGYVPKRVVNRFCGKVALPIGKCCFRILTIALIVNFEEIFFDAVGNLQLWDEYANRIYFLTFIFRKVFLSFQKGVAESF